MANLVSPGVQVRVTDESFFTSTGPGTIPLLFIATKQNKPTPDGATVAPGTLPQNANELFLVSSQRELLQTFGNPDFRSVGGSAQNGNPLNEYGLLAAHSFLGVSNRAYVVRSDVPLEQLEPRTTAPTGAPVDLTYWTDLNNLVPGLFISTGTGTGNWQPVSVTVYEGVVSSGDVEPAFTFNKPNGFVEGDVLLAVGNDSTFTFWQRVGGEWVSIDNFYVSPHTSVPSATGAGQYWLKTTTPNQGANVDVKLYDSEVGSFVNAGTVQIFGSSNEYYNQFSASNVSTGTLVAFASQILEPQTQAAYNEVGTNGTFDGGEDYAVDDVITMNNGSAVIVDAVDGDGAVTAFTIDTSGEGFTGLLITQVSVVDDSGDPAVGSGFTLSPGINNTEPGLSYELNWHSGDSVTEVISDEFSVATSGDLFVNGVAVSLADTDTVSDVAAAINTAAIPGIVAFVVNSNALRLVNQSGRDIVLAQDAFLAINGLDITRYSNFTKISDAAPAYVASFTQPTGATVDGTLWFDPGFRVDILISDGLGNWQELEDFIVVPGQNEGVELFVQSFEPVNSVNPVSPVNADLWVDTSDLANYPVIRRYDGNDWILVDNSDQTTPNGVIFADARPSPATPASDLDADRPDPFAFPRGMLLWNTRYSSRNVKQWVTGYTSGGELIGDRWVSVSGTNPDGSLITGRAAQRAVIVNALRSTVLNNQEIRSETLFANLFAAPGFPELAGDLVTLNIDRRETGFVIADTPFDLEPTGTSLQNYALESAVSSESVAYYYPSALATNLDGTEVVVPASHMALRVYATNDQVSYPWFAPAGFQRGVVTNVRQVGYINGEDEFVAVSLNQGQRDVLYLNNINPIVNFPGRGIIILGQKTRSPVESALDRVNVARLIGYIRFQAERIAEPFLFEPNDTQTRNAVGDRYETFLSELVTLRGVFDFLVVCDETNNTPARIDRNELHIDLAISPAKAIEFVFIPIRVRNTGADLSL